MQDRFSDLCLSLYDRRIDSQQGQAQASMIVCRGCVDHPGDVCHRHSVEFGVCALGFGE